MSYITAVGTANPLFKIDQSVIAEFMITAMQLNEPDARKLRALYKVTGIDSRYSVLEDYSRKSGFSFFTNSDDLKPFPSTADRIQRFRTDSLEISLNAIRSCFTKRPSVDPSSVTHLIVVSCTGMYAPGLDIDIVKALNLSPSISRLCINFMGCYAAFNAMKAGDSICRSEKDAKVLVVCTELCSIHFQHENTEDNLIANALFGDGSAAVLIESKPADGINLVMETFHCALAPEGNADMAWTIGNSGFEMKLSSYVPDIIKSGIRQLTESLLGKIKASLSDISFFAIHPGGKKILEVIEQELGISKSNNRHAYDVLRKYGNMSSATVLFVIDAIAKDLGKEDDQKKILSFAFGPGLTLESMVLKIEFH